MIIVAIQALSLLFSLGFFALFAGFLIAYACDSDYDHIITSIVALIIAVIAGIIFWISIRA